MLDLNQTTSEAELLFGNALPRSLRTRNCRFAALILFIAVASLLPASTASAQLFDSNNRIRESVILPSSQIAENRLSASLEQASPESWNGLLESLDEIEQEYGDKLIAITPGWYVNVRDYCNRVRSDLPVEALATYRARVDPQAKRLLDLSVTQGDQSRLTEIVDRAFVGSWTDQALLRLGDLAWEQGDMDVARRCWRQLLPPDGRTSTNNKTNNKTSNPNEPSQREPATDRAPKSDAPTPDEKSESRGLIGGDFAYAKDMDAAPVAEIHARFILSYWVEGDIKLARQKLAALEKESPDAVGKIAGRDGKLIEILRAVITTTDHQDQADGQDRSAAAVSTFAGNAARNQRFQTEPTPRQITAAVAVETGAGFELEYGPESPIYRGRKLLPYFPVTNDRHVFLANANSVYAWNRHNLRAAWSVPADSSRLEDAEIYRLPEAGQQAHVPAVGVGRYSLTLSGDRLYARLGQPITGKSPRELQPLVSQLVCLDVGRREGSLMWVANPPTGSGWQYEGSPVVVNHTAFILGCRRSPQTELAVFAFDAVTGRPLWDMGIVTLTAAPAADLNRITHLLLTAGEGLLFVSTNGGVVIALDQRDGRIRWANTYSSEPASQLWKLNDPNQWQLSPCLYSHGTVFVAPQDSSRIFAIDALSGRQTWSLDLPPGGSNLLCTIDGLLITTGTSARAIDTETGRIVWQSVNRDPEHFGYGRGAVIGSQLWWPKHEEIEVRSVRNGQLLRRINLSQRQSPSGNLIPAGDDLLIASSRGLVLLSRRAKLRHRTLLTRTDRE